MVHSGEVSVGVLRGSHPARIDDKGRLKVPNSFRQIVEAQWGTELFVTSVTGEYVRVYPMGVWLEIERKLAEVPSSHPSKARFLDRVNFFGQAVSMDRQGRVLVPQLLRESAAMAGEVMGLIEEAVKTAQEAGYANLKGFQAGLPGWKKAKLPVHSEPAWLAKRLNPQHVILDVRDKAASGQGHIQGAVALPVSELQAMTQRFIAEQKAAELPDVSDQRAPIIIYADDLGYGDLGCFGSKAIKTPHIDSLVGGGLLMEAGYVSAPQCVPSRSGLMSGRYQNRFGVTGRQFEQSAESTQASEDAWAVGRFYEGLDAVDQAVTGIDIHAGVPVVPQVLPEQVQIR